MSGLRSPGFDLNEIELSVTEEGVQGVPATIVGTSERGRAFVPHTVGSIQQLRARFGDVGASNHGLHGAYRWLENSTALTFIRVLGAGPRAGFVVDDQSGSVWTNPADAPTNFFLSAQHRIPAASQPALEELGELIQDGDDLYRMVRAQIFVASGWSMELIEASASTPSTPTVARAHTADVGTDGMFSVVLWSPSGDVTRFDVNLDPSSEDYIMRGLNSAPERFARAGHVVWREWEIDPVVAMASAESTSSPVEVSLDAPVLTNADTTAGSGLQGAEAVASLLGRWNNNYRDSVSPWVTSQPFAAEVIQDASSDPTRLKLATKPLFRFHTIDDGTASSTQVKVSIRNVRASTNGNDPYGSFDVVVRRFDDTDFEPQVIEVFPQVNLNPESERYIARVIGDTDIYLNWDKPEDERRLLRRGAYPNLSEWIWVEVHPSVEEGDIPVDTLPFGHEAVKQQRINPAILTGNPDGVTMPPVFFRKKITAGPKGSGAYGDPTPDERVNNRLHWGLRWERMRNASEWNPRLTQVSEAVRSLVLYAGNDAAGQSVSGKEAAELYDSEFNLAMVSVAFEEVDAIGLTPPRDVMRTAYYLRGSEIAGVESSTLTWEVPDPNNPSDTVTRIGLGTLLAASPQTFNRYVAFTGFTLPLMGGWDGTLPFWREAADMSDRASAVDELEPTEGFGVNMLGTGFDNIVVTSLAEAAKTATDTQRYLSNLVATPSYRQPEIVDLYADLCRDTGLLFYVQEVPAFDQFGGRIYTGENKLPDVNNTLDQWLGRTLDNNYVGAYFPDVVAPIPNGRSIVVPASVAALSAIAFNDRFSFPWFAPAGFNRGALPWIERPVVKLLQSARDELYSEAKINPIAQGQPSDNRIVIFGQRTLQQAATALDRINVRRAVLEAKRILRNAMEQNGLYENNVPETRAAFVEAALAELDPIRLQAGAQSIVVICDETNNPPEVVRQNIVRASCVFVPVRVAENIVIDLFISPDGDFSSVES